MELFVAAMAIMGLATTIAAIDESIDWVTSYYREGDEDHEYRLHKTQTYDHICEQGYRE